MNIDVELITRPSWYDEFTEYLVKIFLYDDNWNEETKQEVGTANLLEFSAFLSNSEIEENCPYTDVANIAYDAKKFLNRKDDDPNLSFVNRIIVGDKIRIKDEFRGKGYGTQALEQIKKFFERYEDTLIFFLAYPFVDFPTTNTYETKEELKSLNKGKQRLRKFYESIGFKRVNKSSYTMYSYYGA